MNLLEILGSLYVFEQEGFYCKISLPPLALGRQKPLAFLNHFHENRRDSAKSVPSNVAKDLQVALL